MSHLPFARKYRPQTFDDLIGQPHVTTTLTRALETQRLGQAYLFTGQRGVGKTSAARILAKCLNCATGPTATPCHTCPSCEQIVQGNSLDVVEIDGASNRGIDEIRTLRETVPFAPTTGPFRVYIIDEVHMLTMEAFNALLKTLEEPPAHVKFIFATTAVSKVPATVVSRCQRFDFHRVEAATIVAALQRIAKAEEVRADDAALYAIARASDGSLRDAEVILEQMASFTDGAIQESAVTALLGAVESDTLFAWTRAILERQAPQALAILTSQLEQGKEPAQLLAGLMQHVRNLLIVRSTQEVPGQDELLTRLIDEPADRLAQLTRHAATVTTQELLLVLQLLAGAYELVRRSPMAQTMLELAVIKLSTREQWQSLEEISRRIERLDSAIASPSTAPRREAVPHASASSSSREGAPAHHASESAPASRMSPGPVDTASQSAAPESVPEQATAASAASAPEEIVRLWPTFLERLGAQKMSLAAYLADARPLDRAGRTLTIGLPGFALHQEVLTLADNRRLIDRLLSELCQAAVTVEYTTLPDLPAPPTPPANPAAQPPASSPPIVRDIVNLFNATVLDQPRTTG